MKLKNNVVDFSGETIFVGIDVHKSKWNVTVRCNGFEFKTFSQPGDACKLIGFLDRHFPGGSYDCVYEAGYCGFWIQRKLEELGARCIVVHAGDVPTTDKEKRRKSDPVDSRKLARCHEAGVLTPIHIPSRQLEEDRMILRRRFQLVKDSTRIKNRIKQALLRLGIENDNDRSWSTAYLRWLESLELSGPSRSVLNSSLEQLSNTRKQIREIDKLLIELSRSDRYARNYALLTSIPAVGPITAMTFLTEIGDIGRFKTLDKLCAYVGLIPNTYSSGEKERVGSMTKRGNTFVKRVLIECAWMLIRKDPAMNQAYKKYTARMKSTKAIVRIARKLLRRMRCMLKNNCKYQIGIN